MSYDLRITFSGLSMYVPEGTDTMHVLLPQAGHHEHHGGGADGTHAAPAGGGVVGHQDHGHNPFQAGGGGTGAVMLDAPEDGVQPENPGEADEQDVPVVAVGDDVEADSDDEMDVHHTRLIYDAAYEDPDATQLERKYIIRDFTGRMLDLRGLTTTGEGLDPTIPEEIPSMSRVGRHVDPALVADGALDARLAGRVALGSGALTSCLLGARFNLAGNDQRITVRSEWTVRGVTNEEDVPPAGAAAPSRRPVLASQPENGLPKPLYPIGQTIHLMVFNTTADEFPPHGPGFDVPTARRDAHHFAAYYPLTVEGAGNDIPRRITDRDVEVEQHGPLIKKQGPQTLLGMTCVQTAGSL